MRLLRKVLLSVAGTVVLLLFAGFCWLYFYSGDLPDISRLAQYAPATLTQVSDPCLGSSVAVSFQAIGTNLRNAITAAEASENGPGALSVLLHPNFRDKPNRVSLPVAVSRSMFCSPSKALKRHFDELRTAIQLDRRYSRQQLFTMYANRVYLGSGLTGVGEGAAFYFHKNTGVLATSDAALLVGLMRSPTVYSPGLHPDRALRRRNEVIDAMVASGSITAAEAQAAKAAPLGVAADTNTP